MKEFTRSCSHILNLICFVLHLLLFSFQRSMPRFPFLQPVRCPTVPFCAVSLRQPIYYTTFFSVCQEVFQKFFEVFFGTSFGLLFLSQSRGPVVSFSCPLFGRSIIIPLSVSLVKGFLLKKMHKIRPFPISEFNRFHNPSQRMCKAPQTSVCGALKTESNQTSGMLISTSCPASADFAIPSIIA